MTALKHKKYYLIVWLIPCLLIISKLSYAQCGAAPITAATCTGGNGAATNGVNINGGNTYWFSGGPSTFGSINLNGGTLRVCGHLTITSLNYNSGNLIIESGGILIVGSMSSLNGSTTIINRGSLTINSGFTMQNNNNYIYNDLTTSAMTINGTITINGTSSYIINRGIFTVSGLYLQGPAGAVCEQNNSITYIGALTNETLNSITYSGNGVPACINVTSSAKLDADLTSFSKIGICKGSAVAMSGGALVHAGGGWGSATVHTNCSSCATILSLGFTNFTVAEQSSSILLQWATNQGPAANDIFYVEKSPDGSVFKVLTTVMSRANQNSYVVNDAVITNTKIYYRIRMQEQSGASIYSPIVMVEPTSAAQFMIYPNPVRSDNLINIVIHSAIAETAYLALLDMKGKILLTKTAALVKGSNQISCDLPGLEAGIYTVKISSSASGNLYGRIAVTAGTAFH